MQNQQDNTIRTSLINTKPSDRQEETPTEETKRTDEAIHEIRITLDELIPIISGYSNSGLNPTQKEIYDTLLNLYAEYEQGKTIRAWLFAPFRLEPISFSEHEKTQLTQALIADTENSKLSKSIRAIRSESNRLKSAYRQKSCSNATNTFMLSLIAGYAVIKTHPNSFKGQKELGISMIITFACLICCCFITNASRNEVEHLHECIHSSLVHLKAIIADLANLKHDPRKQQALSLDMKM
jgi:hypothetical protein